MPKKWYEASTVAGIKGVQMPLGATSKKKKKNNPSKPYGEAELFENAVAYSMLDEDDMDEVVRKIGTQWMIFDDETDAQVGAYADRDTAWEKQRLIRRRKAAEREKKAADVERQKKALEPTLAPKPKGQRKAKKESVKEIFESVLQERSMVSYVFENTPISDESAMWDNFLSKLSKQTLMSDPKFKVIIQKAAKSEIKLLGKAVDLIKKALQETGHFEVEKKSVEKDPATQDLLVNFVVKMKEDNKALDFAVKLESGKPLIVFPDAAREIINAMGNQESKLLRAELMHIQETVLDALDDVVSINAKRDSYLSGLEGKLDKFLNSLNFLDVAILKYLLKNKYKGLK